MAWLNAMPKPDPRTKRGQAADQPPAISRAAKMKKDGIPIQMPPSPAPHIIDRLVEIGLTDADGAPISWLAINEWQRATCVHLAPWEARLIRRLSVEYVAESRRAESENAAPPWRTDVTPREREVEEARLRTVLG